MYSKVSVMCKVLAGRALEWAGAWLEGYVGQGGDHLQQPVDYDELVEVASTLYFFNFFLDLSCQNLR